MNTRLTAIALACVAFALFATMSALAKFLGDEFPTTQVVFFRSLFALIPLALIIDYSRIGQLLRVHRPGLLALRALMGLIAMLLFFAAVTVLPLADVVALAFAAPIFTTVLGLVFLGERVGVHRWAAVTVGLVGVIVMVRPGSELFSAWSLLPLGSALFYSVGVIMVRTLSKTESPATIVLYFSLFAAATTGSASIFTWHTPLTSDLVLLVAMGVAGGVMQLCAINALKRAEVTVIAPFEYTSLLWSAALGYLIWHEVPGYHIWAGAVLVGAAAIYIIIREARAQPRAAS